MVASIRWNLKPRLLGVQDRALLAMTQSDASDAIRRPVVDTRMTVLQYGGPSHEPLTVGGRTVRTGPRWDARR